MKFSEAWLREWVDPPVSTEALVEQLTLAGLEVDSAEPVAPSFTGVVVAEIVEVRPHAQSEHLKICVVSAGAAIPLTVVCGAANVGAGLRAPLARIGAKLPEAGTIERSVFRGVASDGMLCSAAELGFADGGAGLMELPREAPVGTDLRAFLALDDRSIDVDLTPNRGDCLGVAGIAREVGVRNKIPVSGPRLQPVAASIQDTFPVVILAPSACPHYAGRVVRGIDPRAETPMWMRERLRRSGVRAISAVVDITNYVMLELGQPMHAFDLARLAGAIKVRFAEHGERMRLLDGQELLLGADTLVIADEERAVAVAGIMGGRDTAVTDATRDIFFESAFFAPRAMAGQARRYRLQTESSQRFERGVDFDLQVRAIERATELLLLICGGQPGPVTAHRSEEHLPRRHPILLRASRIKRLLGISIPGDQVTDTLRRLGMRVEASDDTWRVTSPAFRYDVEIEADLIEEVARIGGYDHVPSHVPVTALHMSATPETKVNLSRIRHALVDRGMQEAVTYSFVDPVIQSRLAPETEALILANPIGPDMAAMRTSLWPGLIQALLYNQNYQAARVRLFEIGLVFSRVDGVIEQRGMIGGAAMGFGYPEQWGAARRAADFYDLKGDVEAILALGGRPDSYEFKAGGQAALHPGQSAVITCDGVAIGMLGALYPSLADELGLRQPVFVFQLELEAVTSGRLPSFRPVVKFPTVRRDLSVVVDRQVSASQVMSCIASAAPGLMVDLQLFDVYQGEGVDLGNKSLALGLIFQGSSSTLVDQEIDALVERVLVKLRWELGAKLRS